MLARLASTVLVVLWGLAALPATALELLPGHSVANISDTLLLADNVDLQSPAGVRQASALLDAVTAGAGKSGDRLIPASTWGGVRLVNKGDTPEVWRLDTRMAGWAYPLEAFAISGTDVRSIMQVDAAAKSAERRVDRIVSSQDVRLAPGQQVDIWLRFDADYVSWQKLALHTYDNLILARSDQRQYLGLVFGAAAVLLGFFGVFAVLLRSLPALFYAVYFLSVFALAAIIEGFFFDTREFELGNTFVTLNVLSRFVGGVGFLLFVSTFVKASRNYPRLYRAMGIFIGLLVPVLGWNLLSYSTASGLAIVLAMVIFLVFVATSVWLAVRDQIPGRWFFAGGVVFLFVSLGTAVLVAIRVVHWDLMFANNMVVLSNLAHGFIFASAVVVQAFALRRDRDTAMQREVTSVNERLAATQAMVTAQQDRDAALAMAQRHRQTLASASHDLRQPLISLQLALSELEASAPAHLRETLHSGLQYLNSVVGENLADASLADAQEHLGKSGDEQIALQLIFDNLHRMFAGEAAEKQLRLRIRPTGLTVNTNPISLVRILVNLVANAIKYTHSGGVLVVARATGGSVKVQVFDTGCGMAPDQIQTLFQPYRQADSNAAGEGLGLSIVHELVNKLGLTITVRSTVAQGSVFTVAGLPVAQGFWPDK